MTEQVTPLNETASQTGGPYVHIGLAPQQAGFEIFDNNFGNRLVEPHSHSIVSKSPGYPRGQS